MKQEREEIFRSLLLASQLGWWMVGAVLAGFLLGYWLDSLAQTHGVLIILFTLLGIVARGW